METLGAFVRGQRLVMTEPSKTVLDAARLMAQSGVGAVPVVDNNRLIGIFTERDVMTRVVATGLDPAQTEIRSVMSTDLIVADVGDGREETLARLQQAHVRHLLVLQDGRLLGIVSIRDLIDHELADKDEALAYLNAYIHDIPMDTSARKRD
jgi:CBS domain-containing protein